MEAIAKARRIPISARKTRKVVNVIRNKTVPEALDILKHLPQKPTTYLVKLLQSAVANLQYKNKEQKILKTAVTIKEIYVDQGKVLKRIQPRARGNASPIRKQSCHITLKVATQQQVSIPLKQEQKPSKISAENSTETTQKQQKKVSATRETPPTTPVEDTHQATTVQKSTEPSVAARSAHPAKQNAKQLTNEKANPSTTQSAPSPSPESSTSAPIPSQPVKHPKKKIAAKGAATKAKKSTPKPRKTAKKIDKGPSKSDTKESKKPN